MWRAGEEWLLEEELTLGVLDGTGPEAFTSRPGTWTARAIAGMATQTSTASST